MPVTTDPQLEGEDAETIQDDQEVAHIEDSLDQLLELEEPEDTEEEPAILVGVNDLSYLFG